MKIGNCGFRGYFILTVSAAFVLTAGLGYTQDDDSNRNVLKQGLLGAGVGAISSSASGGNAGQGALIGAGTNVIGGALLDTITTPSRSSSSSRRVYKRAPAQQQQQDDEYSADGQDEEYYVEEPPQESGSSKVLKQGLLGAGVGAISAGASGGNAGKGALIGAGTNVIGSALLDTITQPSEPKRTKVYRRAPKQSQPKVNVQEQDTTSSEGRKKIIRKYDDNGKVVSEEEIDY